MLDPNPLLAKCTPEPHLAAAYRSGVNVTIEQFARYERVTALRKQSRELETHVLRLMRDHRSSSGVELCSE
jgi:hypothetical protein